MRNKLKLLSMGLLLSGVFGLASCDTVEMALPEAQKSEQILVMDEKIPHNEIEELFEAVVPSNSSTASKVLDSLLTRLSKSYFGEFFGDNGLRKIVESDQKISEFVASHERFQIVVDGQRDTAAEIQGVKDFYDHILTAIRKSFWGSVTNTTYQDRYFFSEKKFYDTQKAALYNLDEAYGEALEDNDHLTQIDGELDYESVEAYFGSATKSFLDVYQDYIERSILPDLYRKVIVENYLQRNNYSALGRSHARKVQTISLKNLDQADATRNLVTHYVEEILAADVASIKAYAHEGAALLTTILTDAQIEAKIDDLRDLHFLSRLYAGIVENDPVELAVSTKLYADSDWSSMVANINGEDLTFYPLTTLGAIYKDYSEISNVRWESSSSTDFTGSKSYTKETGLMLKEREVFSKTSVTEGWYTSSGLSELPSELRSRLFKIQVANDVDSNFDENYKVILNKTMDYGMYVEGSYYLTPETYASTDTHPYLIYDSSSSSWIIVRVDEAVKGPKLSSTDASYDFLAKKGLREGKLTQNEIVWVVTGMIADSDSYVKAARQELIEKAKISYHDQNVYDYFKSNFPDLFD